jgi:hypothetical protein
MHEFCLLRAAAADANETGSRSRRCIRLSTHTKLILPLIAGPYYVSLGSQRENLISSRAAGASLGASDASTLARSRCKCKDTEQMATARGPKADCWLIHQISTRAQLISVYYSMFSVSTVAVSNSVGDAFKFQSRARVGEIWQIIQQRAR